VKLYKQRSRDITGDRVNNVMSFNASDLTAIKRVLSIVDIIEDNESMFDEDTLLDWKGIAYRLRDNLDCDFSTPIRKWEG